ncbi:hypothetical protein SRABI35_01205 [Stenotrophomonas lactitubi]|nr:hypothetical protein SRABI35_01205 [Stenotrophomonas lactitubi]
MRARQNQAEAGAAGGDGDVIQSRLIGPAQLPGDVQPQPGAVFGGGEEGAEQLCGDGLGDAGATVHHVDHRTAFVLGHAQPHACRLLADAAVLQGVVHQHSQHLVQVARVDLCRHRGVVDDRLDAVGFQRLPLLVLQYEAAHEGGQIHVFRVGAFASGQAQHALNDAVGALALLVDDLQQAAVAVVEAGAFLEQLYGVIDGRQRVADLVGEAGRETPHCRQGERFGAARDHAGIIQKHQHQIAAGQQPGEARLHFRLVGVELQRHFILRPAVAPPLQAARQLGGDAGQVEAAGFTVAVVVAQQNRCGFVGQGDAVVGVHHDHTGTHAADDQFVDLEQVGHFVATLVGQLLVVAGAVADLVADEGQGQVAGGEHCQLGQRAGGIAAFQHLPQVFGGGGDAGGQRQQQAPAQRQQGGGGGDVEQQRHRDAGAGAGQGMCQQAGGDDVQQHAADDDGPQPALVAADHQQQQRQQQIGGADRIGQAGVMGFAADRRQRAVQQGGDDRGDQHPVQGEEIQLSPRYRFDAVDQ